VAGVGKYSEIFLSPEHGRRTPSRHPDGNATTDKSDKYDENFLSANEFQSTEYGPADTLPSPDGITDSRINCKFPNPSKRKEEPMEKAAARVGTGLGRYGNMFLRLI